MGFCLCSKLKEISSYSWGLVKNIKDVIYFLICTRRSPEIHETQVKSATLKGVANNLFSCFASSCRNDEKTAADYKILGGSVLHLVLALRGGGGLRQ